MTEILESEKDSFSVDSEKIKKGTLESIPFITKMNYVSQGNLIFSFLKEEDVELKKEIWIDVDSFEGNFKNQYLTVGGSIFLNGASSVDTRLIIQCKDSSWSEIYYFKRSSNMSAPTGYYCADEVCFGILQTDKKIEEGKIILQIRLNSFGSEDGGINFHSTAYVRLINLDIGLREIF